jgi:hypothetical protein
MNSRFFIFPSRPFAFLRGFIIFLKVSALRGRIALPVKDRRLQEARRKRRRPFGKKIPALSLHICFTF